MNIAKRRERAGRNKSHCVMSSKTKDFLQKICYKKTASVDMTQYGFINDSKVNPVNLLLKPLREKLQTICGPSRIHSHLKKQSLSKKTEKGIKSRKKLPSKNKQQKHLTKSNFETKKALSKLPLKKKKGSL